MEKDYHPLIAIGLLDGPCLNRVSGVWVKELWTRYVARNLPKSLKIHASTYSYSLLEQTIAGAYQSEDKIRTYPEKVPDWKMNSYEFLSNILTSSS